MSPRELKHLRRQLGLSQSRFAARIGVHTNTVARWERGELGMKATTDRLIRLITAPGADRFVDDLTARLDERLKSTQAVMARLRRTRAPRRKG